MSDLSKKLLAADRTYGLYRENEKTLVGFSGGADSMALLHVLSRYLGTKNVVAVHINHLLRGTDADEDERFCKEYCLSNGIEFHSLRVDVSALCGGTGIEEAARNARYDVFEKLARKTCCATVSLAHTADDNLETVIFHLCRGAGAAGASGIPPTRPLGESRIVRPLIDCTREDILAYIDENQLSYRTDTTNNDTAYTRNFIRHRIAPLMKEINPRVAENVRNTCTAVAALSAHIEAEAESLLPDGNAKSFPLALLHEKDEALLYALFNRLYQNAGGTALPAAQAKSLLSHIRACHRGVSLSLPHGITAELRGDHLRFFAEAENASPLTEEIPLSIGENRVSDRIFILIGTKTQSPPYTYQQSARIPLSSLSSLKVRPRKNGEGYRFGGMTRKLKKLLSGAETEKKNRPVICDESGILWHPDFPVRDGKAEERSIEIHYFER